MGDITIFAYVLIGIVTGEISLRLVRAHDELMPTLTRFIAVGMAIVAGSFWSSIQHAGLALTLAATLGITVASLALLRAGHYLISRSGYTPGESARS